MSNHENKTKSLLIRRIIAVVMSIAAVLGLFLPMLSLSARARTAFRRVKTEDSKSCKAFITDLPGTVSALLKEGEVEKKYIRTVEDIVSDLVHSVALPLYETGEDHGITFLEICSVAGLPAKAVDIIDDHEDELDDVLREFGDSDPEYKEQEEELRDALDVEPLASVSKIASIALYSLFGVTLLLGVLSIVMELLNRSKSMSVLFCVFAFLTAALFAFVIIGPRLIAKDIEPFLFDLEAEEIGENLTKLANAGVLAITTLLPGAGLIMLPVCSLAACILYKRDRSYVGVFPKRAPKAAAPAEKQRPRPEAVPQKKPVRAPAAPVYAPPAPAFDIPLDAEEKYWECGNCGQQNDMDAKFCCNCGARKPMKQEAPAAPSPAGRFCPVCGRKLSPAHLFCPGCGAKIDSDREQA